MRIEEARQAYRTQIVEYREQKKLLTSQKQELEKKMDTVANGKELFSQEAAILELSLEAVDKKQTEYQDYMSKLTELWALYANAEVAKQQGEAMEDYVADMGKIMEVARRLMKGAIVPATDEKKLMEYSMELYQAAKNIGALAKQKEKEEYDSLWKDEEEETVHEDPMEVADNAQAPNGPEIVDVADTMAKVTITE